MSNAIHMHASKSTSQALIHWSKLLGAAPDRMLRLVQTRPHPDRPQHVITLLRLFERACPILGIDLSIGPPGKCPWVVNHVFADDILVLVWVMSFTTSRKLTLTHTAQPVVPLRLKLTLAHQRARSRRRKGRNESAFRPDSHSSEWYENPILPRGKP